MNIKMINEYSFHEFLASFQEAVIDGWRLDLSSNDLFPQRFGSHLSTGMIKPHNINETLNLPTTLVSDEITQLEAVLPQSNLVVEKQPLQPQEPTPEQKAIVEAVPEVTSETVTPVKTRKGK